METLKVWGKDVTAELVKDFAESEDFEFGSLYIDKYGRYIVQTVNEYEYIDVENEQQALQGVEEYYNELKFRNDKDVDPRIFINNFLLNEIIGKKWGELNKETQEKLLKTATCIDARDCKEVKDGYGIVDFDETTISVRGQVTEDGIEIDDDAEIYMSSDL
jgi:hypothetical protein|nr:MAG TPA: hypothetical protein [Caudoviricetes sp.]